LLTSLVIILIQFISNRKYTWISRRSLTSSAFPLKRW
jgi:hypothetical protein